MKTMFLLAWDEPSGGVSYGYRWWGIGRDFSTLHWSSRYREHTVNSLSKGFWTDRTTINKRLGKYINIWLSIPGGVKGLQSEKGLPQGFDSWYCW